MPTTRRVFYDPETGATIPFAGIKKAQKQAQAAATTAGKSGDTYRERGTEIGSTLVPEYTAEVTHPQGFSPTEENDMLVGAEQGAGGATGALKDEAELAAGRTHNTGALSGVLDEAARGKARAASDAVLNIKNQNALLKQKQKSEGLAGLSGLYGTDTHADLQAQGLVPEDINAWANAGKSGWLQNTMGVLDTAGGLASGAGTLMKGIKARG